MDFLCLLQYGFLGHHYSQINDVQSIAGHYYACYVLSYVVYVALDRGHDDSGLGVFRSLRAIRFRLS